MQNNFPKIPLFISIIFLILASFASWYFYQGISENNAKVESARATWVAEASRRAEIEKFNSAIKTIEPKKAELENHFVQSSDPVPFLDAVEALGSSIQVKTEITTVDIAKDKSGLLVGIKISGSFQNLYKFITLLENFPYQISFVSVDVVKATDLSGTSNSWQGNLQIKLLSFLG